MIFSSKYYVVVHCYLENEVLCLEASSTKANANYVKATLWREFPNADDFYMEVLTKEKAQQLYMTLEADPSTLITFASPIYLEEDDKCRRLHRYALHVAGFSLG